MNKRIAESMDDIWRTLEEMQDSINRISKALLKMKGYGGMWGEVPLDDNGDVLSNGDELEGG